MRQAERVVAVLSVLLGLAVVGQAWRMEYLTELGPGPGFFPLWLGLILTKLTGTKFAIVQFDGSAKAMTALLGGHTDVYFGNVGDTYPQAKAGEVRVLGVMDDEESKFLPGKTTFSQGIKLESSSSRGLSAPAGTPKEIVDFPAAAIKKAIANEEHLKKMEEQGLTVRYMDPARMEKYWAEMEEQIKPLMGIAKEK